MKYIKFFEEKKLIVAFHFKKNWKTPRIESMMFDLWKSWWPDDFSSEEPNEDFREIFKSISRIVRKYSKKKIKEKRRAVSDYSSVPELIQLRAVSLGYFIKKNTPKHRNRKVSGYAIFKDRNDADKNAVLGSRYDLTLSEVEEFLRKELVKRDEL